MRLAAKQVRSQLEWRILDVEQDEWDRQVGSLDVAAAANGFPVYVSAKPAGTAGDEGVRPESNRRTLRIGRWVVLGSAAAIILCLVASYAVWRTAQEGIVRMQGDVANAVKLETVKAHAKQAAPPFQQDVQSVAFQGDKAMAAVIVTHTLPTGAVVVRPETHFYVLTAKGWQRTGPQAEFWGPTETLDTASLHFVFGSADRETVELVAQSAEALYAALRRATGEDLTADDRLTIELVPDDLVSKGQPDVSVIRLASPAFADRGVPLPRGDTFVLLQLRRVLARDLADAALQRSPPQAAWTTVVDAYEEWLQLSDAVQPSPPSELAVLLRQGTSKPAVLPLEYLLDSEAQHESGANSGAYQNYEEADWQGRRRVAAGQLIDFLVGRYGIEMLPKLSRGFSKYGDWDTLAPAVLGVSAADLEAAWHMYEADAAPHP